MTIAILILLFVLIMLLTLASYVERIYTEMGKFLSREFQENIEAYELRVEPLLGRVRNRAPLSMSVLAQLSTAGIAMCIIYIVMADGHWALAEIAQALLAVALIILVFNRLLPFVFFTRTKGEWLVKFAPLLHAIIYLMLPITIVLGFCLQIAALAEQNEPVQAESQSEAVDALIEAGQEEGILEEGDRQLIQSVVEFRDKTVREVMTARPEIFGVPATTTIEEFTEMLRDKPYSRVPVFEGSIDHIKGLVFAHDVLQISDVEAHTRTVRELMKPIYFVPESKPVQALMREMQAQKAHMAMVIDEYGSVAGVVTIEDLLEELVGEITDEHEPHSDVIKERDGSYLVPGNMDIDRLDELFGVRPENVQATTVAGLVSELVGRIPDTGEVIQQNGLRYEILKSTDRLVERLRISLNEAADTVQSKGRSS
ncbi:MAG: CBS/transporter domain protein [Acidobacteriales bacterium]|nr:CBS/transporter domain protein [Terriglobales bacterium]